jgi:hypothetical protein
VYSARLTATDDNGAITSDFVTVTVLTCNAGVDQIVALPINSASIVGVASTAISATAYLWEKITGPAGGNITNPTILSTTVTSLQAGDYEYQLTVTHTGGYVVRDRIKIAVVAGVIQNTYRIIRGN